MKKVLILTIFICFINGMAFAGNANDDKVKHNMWFEDSYKYGKNGNNCSEIYHNYGTDKWTFNADDPTLLKIFYEACKAGEDDRLTGNNNLPQLINTFKQNRK